MGSADPGQTFKVCKGPFIFIYIGGKKDEIEFT